MFLRTNCCALLVGFIFIFNTTKADRKHLVFGFDNHKESVTIPFKCFNNLIIIEAIIDDKNTLNLILDTGIRSLVLFSKSYVPRISDKTFEIKFTGTGDHNPITAKVSTRHNLRLCKDVVANQINAVILNRSNYFLHKLGGIKIHGAFGYQLFTRFQVKIDYKNHLLTLTEPSTSKRINGYEAIPIKVHDTKPFIESNILTAQNKWMQLNLILDIGANHKVLLHQHPEISNSIIFNKTRQRIAEGLNGSIYGNIAYLKNIRIGSLSFGNTEILIPTKNTYYTESTTIKKHGSIGGSFFEGSTIIIDYINGYLFIENPGKKNQDYFTLN